MSKRATIVWIFIGLGGFAFSHHPQALWVAIVCLMCLFGIASRVITFPRREMVALPEAIDVFRLLPRWEPREQLGTEMFVLAAGIIASVGIAIAHGRGPASDELSLVETWGGLFAFMAAIELVRKTSAARKRSPRLLITTDHPQIGEPFELRIDALSARTAKAYLRCYEHLLLHFGRYVHADVRPKSEQIVMFDPLSSGQQVTLDGATHLPTGRTKITSHPFYHWEIHVVIGDSNPIVTIFPFTVFKSNSPTEQG